MRASLKAENDYNYNVTKSLSWMNGNFPISFVN